MWLGRRIHEIEIWSGCNCGKDRALEVFPWKLMPEVGHKTRQMDKRSNPQSISQWKDYLCKYFYMLQIKSQESDCKRRNKILEKQMSYVTLLVLMIGVKFVFFNIHLNLKLCCWTKS